MNVPYKYIHVSKKVSVSFPTKQKSWEREGGEWDRSKLNFGSIQSAVNLSGILLTWIFFFFLHSRQCEIVKTCCNFFTSDLQLKFPSKLSILMAVSHSIKLQVVEYIFYDDVHECMRRSVLPCILL